MHAAALLPNLRLCSRRGSARTRASASRAWLGTCALARSAARPALHRTQALLETAGHSILTQSDDERPEFNLLTADDVMCRTPVCVHVSERLLTLARLVSASPHPGFPIVDSRTYAPGPGGSGDCGRTAAINAEPLDARAVPPRAPGRSGDDALPGRSASSASVAPAIVPASSEAGVRRVHGAAGTELGARRAPPSCFQSPSAREPQPEAGYFTGFVTRERIVDILRLAFEHESGSSTTDRTTSGGGRGTLSGSARRVGGARRRRRGSGIVLPPLFPPLPPPSPPLRPPSSPREQRLGAAGVVGARMSASASCLAAAAAASAPSAADGVETEARALAGVELENAVGALATKLDGRPGAAQGAEARSTPQRAGRRTAALSDASGARGLLARSSHTAAETVLSAASAPTPLVRRHVRVSAAFASGGGASRDGAASAGGDPPVVRDAARPAEERELARALASLDIAADPRKVAARCGMWVPLRPESDIVPHVLGKDAPVRVLLQTFISLGARHVTVVDSSRRVVGIVTRADVLPDVRERCARHHRLRRRATALASIAPPDHLTPRAAHARSLCARCRCSRACTTTSRPSEHITASSASARGSPHLQPNLAGAVVRLARAAPPLPSTATRARVARPWLAGGVLETAPGTPRKTARTTRRSRAGRSAVNRRRCSRRTRTRRWPCAARTRGWAGAMWATRRGIDEVGDPFGGHAATSDGFFWS